MNLCEQIRDRVEQCLSTGSGCYVLVRGVDFDTIQAIDHVFGHMGVRVQNMAMVHNLYCYVENTAQVRGGCVAR